MINIVTIEGDGAANTTQGNFIIDAIETANEGGFAASRGSDEGGDFFCVNVQIDVKQGLFFAIENTEAVAFDERTVARRRSLSFTRTAW